MEFETGGRPDPSGFGGSGGDADTRPPGRSASAGGEFDLRDPVNSFLWAVKSLVTAPTAFFRGMPRNASIKNPLAFAVICALIAGVPAALLVLLIGLLAGVSGDVTSALGGIFGAILVILAYPVATVVGLFIGAGIFHLLVLLFIGQSNAGFGTTFRVVSYASFPNALGFLAFIPILGILVGLAIGAYALVLHVLGIREGHATTTGKGALVILTPLAVIFALFLMLLLLLVVIRLL